MASAIHGTKLEKQRLNPKQNQQEPSKFYYHFLYKAAIVAILLVILSQAPEFINQSLLTKNWELLHLLFVGIAISYGLFSRPNHETEKDNNTKFDNTHTVVSRFLQVSSFFEDETESLSESESDHETQVRTRSVKYYRNKPNVVVAPKHSNFEQQSATSSTIGEKPLLLPVRSLKSRVSSDPGDVFIASKRFSVSSNSNKARNNGGGVEGSRSPKVEEDKVKENTVLPSPIPWRSSLLETEFNKVESCSMTKSQKSPSFRPNSMSSSPKGVPSESLAKNGEDLTRKKGFYSFSPPPPPPPPPIFQKSISMKPRSSSFNKEANHFDKELKRSFTSERNELKRRSSGNSEKEVKPNLSMGKSERTFRSRGESKEKGQLEEDVTEEPTRKVASCVPLVSEEEKERIFDKVIVESYEEDSESEDEEKESKCLGESTKIERGSSSNCDEGVDVDKQADEFIAKFREQIRLQRIASIKRSARVATINSSK